GHRGGVGEQPTEQVLVEQRAPGLAPQHLARAGGLGGLGGLGLDERGVQPEQGGHVIGVGRHRQPQGAPEARDPVDESLTEALTQLVRIGWTSVEGYLDGGFEAWRTHGGAISSYDVASADDLCEVHRRGERPYVLDVRQELEWGWGTVPDSRLVFVADLPQELDGLPRDEPV